MALAKRDFSNMDALESRLEQATGCLMAVLNTYNDKEKNYVLPPEHMSDALSGVHELICQAREALYRENSTSSQKRKLRGER
jgi:hypothetical protein